MKPIKILLLFCVFLMGAIGVRGQVTAIQAPSTTPTATGTLCVGSTIVANWTPSTATYSGGCSGAHPSLELVSSGGIVLATASNPSVTLNSTGTLSLVIPASAAGTSGNYLRYVTTDAGCTFTGAGTSSPGFSVSAVIPGPTKIKDIDPVCAGVTQPTVAALQTEGNYVTCGANAIVINAALATTAGSYTAVFTCASAGCQSSPLNLPYTVNGATTPTLVKTIPNICNGATQLTVAQLEVDGAYVNCAGAAVPKVTSAAPGNTVSSVVTFACVDGACTSVGTLDINAVVQAVVAGPTGATGTTTVAGASGNGTTAIGVCSTAGSGDLSFTATCAGSTGLIVRDAATNAVLLSTAPYIISPAPTVTTSYKLTCRESDPTMCESPTFTTVTFTVTTAPQPIKVMDIAAICDGGTQPTVATLQTEGTYVTCGAGNTIVVNAALATTGGTYTAEFKCINTATGCQSTPLNLSYTVNAAPTPTLAATIPNICNGATQLTIAQLEVDGAYVNCAGAAVPKVTSAAPGNTVSSVVTFACVDGACTSIGTLDINAVVQAVVAGPTAATASTTVSGASGNGTAAVGVCSTSGSGTLTFAATCAGSTGLIVRDATTNAVVLSTGPYTIPAPAATTSYKLTCRESDPTMCESPTFATVTFTVTTAPQPIKVMDIAAICAGGTQPTVATLQTEGTYVTCGAGNTIVVNAALATTAGTYMAEFKCINTATGCQSIALNLPYTVNALPSTTPTLVATIPNICNGATQLTIAQLEVDGAYVSCAGASVPKVTSGAPSNTVSGVVTFACAENGCLSTGGTLPLNAVVQAVVAGPTAATASTTVTGASGNGTTAIGVCSTAGSGTLTFAATCAGSTGLIVRDAATNAIVLSTGPYTIPAPAATTSYKLTCRESGPTMCESPTSTTVTFTVTTTPQPIKVKDIDASCAGETQPTVAALQTEGNYVSCGAGNTIVINAVLATVAGSYTAEFKCLNTATGCQSIPLNLPYSVNVKPNSPTLVPISGPAVCNGVAVTLAASGCLPTETVKIWTSDVTGTTLGTLLKSVVGSSTTVDVTPSVTSYYVATCSSATCNSVPSPKATVTVNPIVMAPTSGVLIPSSRCASESPASVTMTTNTNCGVNATIWYESQNATTPIASLPTMTPTETKTYYAACRDLGTGCESLPGSRYAVTFTYYPQGSTPANVFLVADGTTVNAGQNKVICDLPGDAITFSGCLGGETILVSVDGGAYSSTLPTQLVTGIAHNYRIRCQAGSGPSACPGPESGVMTLTIFAQPTTPPVANLSPSVVCSSAPSVPFGGSSNCGTLATVWFDASNNMQLASLPAATPTTPGVYSYYAKCVNAGGCTSPASATVSLTVVGNSTAPTITSAGGDEVCTGINVSLTTNCPVGSSVVWSNGFTGNVLDLVSNVPQVRAVSAKCVTTVGSVTCETPSSAVKTIIWKAFDLTIINIGSSESGIKPGSNVPKSAWAANFVTVDAGPSLQSSSQSNPTVYFTENPNKGAPRFWTIHVEACALGTSGAISYDMLATPEVGVQKSFNTVENNAPYLMYANRDNFTELYAQNNPFFGFYADANSDGINDYNTGLPKGLYKLSVRYWSQKGLGIAPAVRIPQGTELAYQEYWFRLQSQNGIGSGAAREGVSETAEVNFATVAPNPVTRTLTVAINGAKGQEVKLNLVDAAGRIIKTSTVTPETNTHREEVDMSSQNTGMYFMNISTPSKRATLKVLKVSQD